MEEKQRKGTQTSSNRANKATRNENTSSPPRPKRRTTPTSWAPQKKRRCDPEPEAKPSGQHEQKKPKTNGNNVPRRGDSLPLFTEPPFEDLFRAKDLRPELPPITDPELLDAVWNNYTQNGGTRTRTEASASLEWRGDGFLSLISRTKLPRILGRRNHRLVKVLVDHAKSNEFLINVGKAYRLDKWMLAGPVHETDKQWADMVEIWLGAAIDERDLWQESTGDASLFLVQLWEMRYREFELSLIPRGIESIQEEDRVSCVSTTTRVHYPDDVHFMRKLGFNTKQSNRHIGYMVKSTPKSNRLSHASAQIFDENPERAKALAEAAVHKLVRQRRESSESSREAVELRALPMGQSLFQQYRSKMFKEIQYRVHDETGISLQTVIRRLEKQYSKWIDDLESLQPTEDQKKTIAMILWSQSFMYALKRKSAETYTTLLKLVQYAITRLPETHELLSRTMERLEQLKLDRPEMLLSTDGGHLVGQVRLPGHTGVKWSGKEFWTWPEKPREGDVERRNG